jgi:hypothetical protein
MINKHNEDKPIQPQGESGFLDVARIDVQAHIVIKDKDSGEVIVNKRG